MERQEKEPCSLGTQRTADRRGDKNDTPSNTNIPQRAEKFHFDGDFHRYSDGWQKTDNQIRDPNKWCCHRGAGNDLVTRPRAVRDMLLLWGYAPPLWTITPTFTLCWQTNLQPESAAGETEHPYSSNFNGPSTPKSRHSLRRWAALLCSTTHLQGRVNSKKRVKRV